MIRPTPKAMARGIKSATKFAIEPPVSLAAACGHLGEHQFHESRFDKSRFDKSDES